MVSGSFYKRLGPPGIDSSAWDWFWLLPELLSRRIELLSSPQSCCSSAKAGNSFGIRTPRRPWELVVVSGSFWEHLESILVAGSGSGCIQSYCPGA